MWSYKGFVQFKKDPLIHIKEGFENEISDFVCFLRLRIDMLNLSSQVHTKILFSSLFFLPSWVRLVMIRCNVSLIDLHILTSFLIERHLPLICSVIDHVVIFLHGYNRVRCRNFSERFCIIGKHFDLVVGFICLVIYKNEKQDRPKTLLQGLHLVHRLTLNEYR